MKKLLFPVIFILFALQTFAQTNLPDNFKIGNSVEVFGRDSLKVYFNCTGTVTDQKCASFYRIGKIDSSIVNISGEFHDYDIDGNLYLTANMRNNSLEGSASWFFSNGRIREEGRYENNKRVGKWTYYYSSGKVEKIYNYDTEEPTVLEAYKKNGDATVVNGNGKIHTKFRNYKQCTDFEVWGELVNGKKNGNWTFSNTNSNQAIATELYEAGNFISGGSGDYQYTVDPKIKLTRYYPNENLNLVDNMFGCPGDSYIFSLTYNNENLNKGFYPLLEDAINKNNDMIKEQWLIVGLKIDKRNNLQEVNVASSINDNLLENKIYRIIQPMTGWKTASANSKKVDSDIYFSILVDNNQAIVLPYYVYRNR